jgi:hypothetical protein
MPEGYGRIRTSFRKNPMLAHRVTYMLMNGPIPEDLVVRHTCDNPPCVRPDHLVVGTSGDNTQDCIERGRFRIGGDPRRQLTQAEISDIVSSHAGGESTSSIASRHGVHAQTVRRHTTGGSK